MVDQNIKAKEAQRIDNCRLIIAKKNNRQSTKVFSEKNLRIKINIKHASIIKKFIKKTVNRYIFLNRFFFYS